MSIIRIGSNKQYADGWELIFGGKRGGKGAGGKASGGKSTGKAATAKRPAKSAVKSKAAVKKKKKAAR